MSSNSYIFWKWNRRYSCLDCESKWSSSVLRGNLRVHCIALIVVSNITIKNLRASQVKKLASPLVLWVSWRSIAVFWPILFSSEKPFSVLPSELLEAYEWVGDGGGGEEAAADNLYYQQQHSRRLRKTMIRARDQIRLSREKRRSQELERMVIKKKRESAIIFIWAKKGKKSWWKYKGPFFPLSFSLRERKKLLSFPPPPPSMVHWVCSMIAVAPPPKVFLLLLLLLLPLPKGQRENRERLQRRPQRAETKEEMKLEAAEENSRGGPNRQVLFFPQRSVVHCTADSYHRTRLYDHHWEIGKT